MKNSQSSGRELPCGTKATCFEEKNDSKSIYAHKIEAHESRRDSIQQTGKYGLEEEGIADRGYNSMSHNNLVPDAEAMKNLEAKAAVCEDLNMARKESKAKHQELGALMSAGTVFPLDGSA